MATNFLKVSSAFENISTFFGKACVSSCSRRPLKSFSSPFVVRCLSENERRRLRNRSIAATLHKQVKKEILDNNPDKAIFIFDEWKVGKLPLFEDEKTTGEIIAMSKGEFEIYVCEKYLDDPSQMKETEKIGNKKRMKVMKPKQEKNVGSSNTTQDEETDKDLKKNVASLPDENMEKLVKEESATPDEETEKDVKEAA